MWENILDGVPRCPGLFSPVMGKQKSPEGSAESSRKPIRYRDLASLHLFNFFSYRVGWSWVCLFETTSCYVDQAGLKGRVQPPAPKLLGLKPQLWLSQLCPLAACWFSLIPSSLGFWYLFLTCPQEPLKSLRPRKVSTPASSSQKAREEKTLLPLELQDDGSDSEFTSADHI